jgi:glycosyltransferase involved in cell wall biosynthesis
VIPCFNQGQYAAESVGSALAQDYPNVRIVLLDDASTDGTSPDQCRQLASDRVKVVCLDENQGRASIRNRGVEELGDVDFVLMLDCDDRLTPTYVTQLVAAFDEDPTVGLVHGTLHKFGTRQGKPAAGTWPREDWSRELMYLENRISGGGTMIRKLALDQTEGWRAIFNRSGGEDVDISLQVLEQGWFPKRVEQAVYHYRIHDSSSIATKSEFRHRLVELNILRSHLSGITKSCGVERFLKPRVMPALLKAIHERDTVFIKEFLPTLLRLCPGVTVKMLTHYYCSRLAAIFRRGSKLSRVPE